MLFQTVVSLSISAMSFDYLLNVWCKAQGRLAVNCDLNTDKLTDTKVEMLDMV